MTERGRILIFCWLFGSALLTVFLFTYGYQLLGRSLGNAVTQSLRHSLEEQPFADDNSRADSIEEIQRAGERVNQALRDALLLRWYAPYKTCRVAVVRIGDVGGMSAGIDDTWQVTSLSARGREVRLALKCQPNWLLPTIASLVLGLIFFCLYRWLPPPLSAAHRQWINYLLQQGYQEDQATIISQRYGSRQLSFNTAQCTCFTRLTHVAGLDCAAALDIASDPRVGALEENDLDWLVLAAHDGLERGLELASAEDIVVIDLEQPSLTIRGLSVPMTKTPLFYYALYADKRLSDDGWLGNPASNRPDREVGRELADLMERFGGHARAIRELEAHGLRARTLDQNRSKIREEIKATLGETLASRYLFESDRQGPAGRARYRLRCSPAAIRLQGGHWRPSLASSRKRDPPC